MPQKPTKNLNLKKVHFLILEWKIYLFNVINTKQITTIAPFNDKYFSIFSVCLTNEISSCKLSISDKLFALLFQFYNIQFLIDFDEYLKIFDTYIAAIMHETGASTSIRRIITLEK